VRLYAESSAVLSWLLGEPRGVEIRTLLQSAEFVIASDVTLIECDRVLVRAVALGEMREGKAAQRRAALNAAAAQWHVLHLAPVVVERARRPFPAEPIRTLDAIHLASALVARTAVADLALLSLDERVRAAATELGIELQPANLRA